ncbi:hypothetical protein [Candidatus Kuenenia sp.]|uniref:hypothetical protein n=1 Tax=Candidatus Kuenenia sp. TaxID=2499824 RepID=UPI00321F9BA3
MAWAYLVVFTPEMIPERGDVKGNVETQVHLCLSTWAMDVYRYNPDTHRWDFV